MAERSMPWRVLGSGALCILAGAAGWYFAADLELGKPSLLGPGAVPIALSIALVIVGMAQLVAAWRSARSDGETPPRSRLRSAIAALALVLIAFGLLFAAPLWLTSWLIYFGPPEMTVWVVLILALGTAAAALVGSWGRALGALLIGLLLGMSGLDPMTGIIRYFAFDLVFVHGLVVAFIGALVGFNPLLMALGFLLSARVEEDLRRSLMLSDGSELVFLERPISASLLGAALAVVLLALWLRRRLAR